MSEGTTLHFSGDVLLVVHRASPSPSTPPHLHLPLLRLPFGLSPGFSTPPSWNKEASFPLLSWPLCLMGQAMSFLFNVLSLCDTMAHGHGRVTKSLTRIQGVWGSNMAQQGRVTVINSDNLTLILGTDMEEEDMIPASCPLTSTHTGVPPYMHTRCVNECKTQAPALPCTVCALVCDPRVPRRLPCSQCDGDATQGC